MLSDGGDALLDVAVKSHDAAVAEEAARRRGLANPLVEDAQRRLDLGLDEGPERSQRVSRLRVQSDEVETFVNGVSNTHGKAL